MIKSIEKSFHAMGTFNTITVYQQAEEKALEAAVLRVLELDDHLSVLTSGSYERFTEIGGIHYHHILNPATGAPSDAGLCSVTVVGASATELDALSTAIFVLGDGKRSATGTAAEGRCHFCNQRDGCFCFGHLT